MTVWLNPYLSFRDNAREAMTFFLGQDLRTGAKGYRRQPGLKRDVTRLPGEAEMRSLSASSI